MSKMWYIHSVEYYLAIKRNEALIHVTNRWTLEEGKHKRLHVVWCHLYEMFIQTKQSFETESRSVVAWSWKCQGRWEMTVKEYTISFGNDENILKLIVVMVVQLCEYTENHWALYFKWVNCIVGELYLSKAVFKKWCSNSAHTPTFFNWQYQVLARICSNGNCHILLLGVCLAQPFWKTVW